MRVIIHADLNSFFASVEQQADPALRGQPVGILKAKGRTCVIAASDEAKSFGVKTGTNVYEARALCPQIILIPADFPKYEVTTQKFIRLTAEFSDRVEVFSLDEVFLDITDTAWWFGGPVSLAKKLQLRVKQELGEAVGCSIGIAGNKLMAKMASGLAPRRGILEVTEANKQKLLARAPFTEVCGIGYRLTKRLHALGINSLPQISATPDSILLANFGPFWGRQLKRMSRGEDDSPVVTNDQLRQAKSVSRTYTLYQDTNDQAKIKALLRNLVEEAAWKLRQMGLVGRQFGLGI
ncbi:DNA polymerase IV, partial [Patescibacteria group bacterium]|nr:DNA polymerase IV [Patescibacteria group bacterium]